ncbi:hypothetical protein D3C81_1781800 [compost metagenome]
MANPYQTLQGGTASNAHITNQQMPASAEDHKYASAPFEPINADRAAGDDSFLRLLPAG